MTIIDPVTPGAAAPKKLGRRFDLQEMHVHLITLSGHIDESDDEFNLSWKQ